MLIQVLNNPFFCFVCQHNMLYVMTTPKQERQQIMSQRKLQPKCLNSCLPILQFTTLLAEPAAFGTTTFLHALQPGINYTNTFTLGSTGANFISNVSIVHWPRFILCFSIVHWNITADFVAIVSWLAHTNQMAIVFVCLSIHPPLHPSVCQSHFNVLVCLSRQCMCPLEHLHILLNTLISIERWVYQKINSLFQNLEPLPMQTERCQAFLVPGTNMKYHQNDVISSMQALYACFGRFINSYCQKLQQMKNKCLFQYNITSI